MNASIKILAADEHDDPTQKRKWRNQKGRFIPTANVSVYDQKKERMLISLLRGAQQLSEDLQEFKRGAFAMWRAFEAEALEDYGVETTTDRGNGTLYSFDQQYKVQMNSCSVIEFDSRIKAAQSLISELLREWGKNADENIMAIVNSAFETDQKGLINVRRILGLNRIKIQDDRWTVAMQAIQDSIIEVDRASYLNFYRRVEVNGKTQWELIPLSLARA